MKARIHNSIITVFTFSSVLLGGMSMFTGCSDYEMTKICSSTDPAFDIEEVSSLEDASGPGVAFADGIVLEFPSENLPDGAQWRITGVDILVMIPTDLFDYAVDGVPMTIEVFDRNELSDPTPTWSVSQALTIGDLEWEDHTFDGNSANALFTDYKKAWWNFDFNDETLQQYMENNQYIVAVRWDDIWEPTVGYSNYNRPCDKNWTVYTSLGSEDWVLNDDSDRQECSWPMFKVNTQITWESQSDGC